MKSVVKGKAKNQQSLYSFLKNELGLSSSLIKKAKRIENGILVNGELKFTNVVVNKGDLIEVTIQTSDEKSENIPLCDTPINIAFEDKYLLIINKDGEIPTHPSINNYAVSVGGAVLNYYKKQGKNFVFRPVNRLDKGTSGLMVIAKNPQIHELLKKSLHSGDFKREYLAVVCGNLQGGGRIDKPIYRADKSIIKRIVDDRGSSAVTNYEVVKNYGDKTLIKLNLETGRTHQIRVHLSFLGHPVYGDFLYGKSAKDINRPALHSYKINLTHPVTKKRISIEIPLKDDIKKILDC